MPSSVRTGVIIHCNPAYNDDISKLNVGVCLTGRFAVLIVKGEKERAQHIALWSTNVKGITGGGLLRFVLRSRRFSLVTGRNYVKGRALTNEQHLHIAAPLTCVSGQ